MTGAATTRLVDTNAAAVAVDRAPATIRSWANRGKITRAGTDPKGRALWDLAQVYRAGSKR